MGRDGALSPLSRALVSPQSGSGSTSAWASRGAKVSGAGGRVSGPFPRPPSLPPSLRPRGPPPLPACPGGFEINLDQRKLRTPQAKLFAVPSEALAVAVAAEWDAQQDTIQLYAMHLVSAAAVPSRPVPSRDAPATTVLLPPRAQITARSLLCPLLGAVAS